MRRLHHFAPLCTTLLLFLALPLLAAAPPPENDIRLFAPQIQATRSSSTAAERDLCPEDLAAAYEAGFVGAFVDSPDLPDWAREAAQVDDLAFDQVARPQSVFSAAFPNAWTGAGRDRHAVYWNYALRFDGDPTPVFKIQQITGNCVAASAGDVSLTHCLGVAMFLHGRPFDWRGCGSTVFYAFRGHGGQGATLGSIAAAHASSGWAARAVYAGGTVDLTDTKTDQQYGQNHWRNPAQTLAPLWSETAQTPIGRVARFDGGLDELLDLLYAGGSLQTGGRITASRDGAPISRAASVGPHAQSIIGYEARPEVLAILEFPDGQPEPIFFFSQTWGEIRYVQSGWLADRWGTQPQGCFILPWSVVSRMLSGSYAYWPDLTGFKPEAVKW